jgi:hypothetical protein
MPIQNATQPDAELLMVDFIDDVCSAHFHIASERASDLQKILGGPPWPVDFTNTPANFGYSEYRVET